jgi:PmbA protein
MVEAVLDALKAKKIEKYELIVRENKRTKVVVKKAEIDNFKSSVEKTFTLKIIKNKKIGFTYFTSTDTDLENIIDKAVSLASYNTSDILNDFYNNEFSENKIARLYNKRLDDFSMEKQKEAALLIEEYAYKIDNRVYIVNESQCFKGEVNVDYINSYGIDEKYSTNYIGAAVVVVAKDNNSQMLGYEHYISKGDDIDSKKIAQSAVNKAVRMLNAEKGNSLKCPVIFENELVADILTIVAQSFYIENIEKNKSLFSKLQIGDKVASSDFSLIDDATDTRYIGAAKFDDEGSPTSKKILIKDGVLNNYLFNLYYAKKKANSFAGNGFLPNFRTFQTITYTNLILPSGKTDIDNGVKSLNKGLFLTSLMGLHMADPITGDFSLGAEGILIENGELTIPVKEIIINGNIKTLLKNCKEVFNDLKVSGSVITPSILVEGLTISGN